MERNVIQFANVFQNLSRNMAKVKKKKRECPQCGFSVEIETAGVHFSENGGIKVYCDEDPFSCPNFPYTERDEISGIHTK